MGHHRRTLSAASHATDGSDATWHDAQECLEHHDLDSAHEEADAACPEEEAAQEAAEAPVPEGCRVVDWHDEAQMLPPNHLSLEERLAAIHSLRKIVLAEADAEECAGVEDRSAATLERFLRARKYDVAVAAQMYLEHRRWRASFSPTPWVQGPENVAAQLAQRKVAMQGLCRDGMPFVVVVARHHRPTGREGVPELHRAFVYIMDCITAAAGPGGMFRILVDLRSMSTANADLNAMKVAFDVLQKGFPERMAHLWLAEPPRVFLALWKLMAPFVAPSTREKINFVAGRDVAASAGRFVDPRLLPQDWGGDTPLRYLDENPAIWEPPRPGPGEPPNRRY